VTFDVSGWRTLAGEGRGIALELAVLAAENPQLDAIRGVPHGPWKGVWLTRPTAWVHIEEAPTIRGIAATFETAMRKAKALAVADPGRTGDVVSKSNVALSSGPLTWDVVNAGRVAWTTTETGRDGIDRELQRTIYLIEAPGSLLRLEAVTLAGAETTPFDVLALIRTIWAPRPLITCEPQWAWEPYCLPEPVMPASRSRVLP